MTGPLRPVAFAAALALLAGAGLAQAQMMGILTGPVHLYQGPGDIVSGAEAWYGLRAYDAAAAGSNANAIAVRNTATNETCNVPVVPTGGLGNVAGCSGSSSGDTLATFCAESSGSCAVTELYDQTGNGWNCSQSTAADQPTLTLSAIGSLPSLTFNGSETCLTANFVNTSTPYSMSGVFERTSGFTSLAGVFGQSSGGTASPQWFFYSAANTTSIESGTQVSATAADSAFHAGNFVFGTSAVLNIDGTETTGNSGTTGFELTEPLYIGSARGNDKIKGDISEVGLWLSGFTSGNRASLCHNQYEYWGTATSC